MKIISLNSIVLLTTISLLGGCNSDSKTVTPTPVATPAPTTPAPTTPTTDLSAETLALGISDVPKTLINTYSKALKFNRYTKIDSPDGNAIHIVAQDAVTDNQIVRSRNILQHYLTDYPGSEYGVDKSAVANKIAENAGVLLLLNGVDDGTNAGAELDGQPLYYGEMQVEGGSWYINQNYDHRDASFEEILHFVHDYGIGVDQNTVFNGVLPNYQAEIRAAQVTALSGKLWAWTADQASWITELTAENSLSQEYLASVIDSYYGLWGAYKESPYGMWGMYIAKTRNDLAAKDPQGAAIMDNKFFHPYLTYNARIDESFVGDFSLSYNASLSYTHHAQYLKDVTLTGSNSSNVIVNQLDNNITGNSAVNTVIFSGPSSEYQISTENGQVTVHDMQDNRDGLNTLISIEMLKFSDMTMDAPNA
ncbi:hypothetical protein [Colwellia psychrerythraea]|uniref:Putative lipoprotein n=1 Tax=Colwellia psychrerythraea (strain 34H / ATCC BAA-681) TaxID=167879 RepID=Q47ZK8_COLP3|nr:hypothetical protein [Colwellia psychrerythraea]AAZ24933.1 putative lipoprotein [Colwellia psychrerythraea 34H]